jgi:hypothetical protein
MSLLPRRPAGVRMGAAAIIGILIGGLGVEATASASPDASTLQALNARARQIFTDLSYGKNALGAQIATSGVDFAGAITITVANYSDKLADAIRTRYGADLVVRPGALPKFAVLRERRSEAKVDLTRHVQANGTVPLAVGFCVRPAGVAMPVLPTRSPAPCTTPARCPARVPCSGQSLRRCGRQAGPAVPGRASRGRRKPHRQRVRSRQRNLRRIRLELVPARGGAATPHRQRHPCRRVRCGPDIPSRSAARRPSHGRYRRSAQGRSADRHSRSRPPDRTDIGHQPERPRGHPSRHPPRTQAARECTDHGVLRRPASTGNELM